MREKGRDAQRKIFLLLVHRPNAYHSLGWAQEPAAPSESLGWVVGTQELAPSAAAFQVRRQKAGLEGRAGLDASHSYMGGRCPKPRLNLLCHS